MLRFLVASLIAQSALSGPSPLEKFPHPYVAHPKVAHDEPVHHPVEHAQHVSDHHVAGEHKLPRKCHTEYVSVISKVTTMRM